MGYFKQSREIKIKEKSKLSKNEITYMVNGFMDNSINKKEMSEFLLAIKENGLSYKETFYLTSAMIDTGDVLDLSDIKKTVVDKHSTGGVGDKTSLIVAPIVASCGLGVAKMSGRSLGFTGGTIDKLESIKGYNVNLSNEEFVKIVNDIGISIISQTKDLAPADKKIYALRDEIGAVESIPLIASSIMSKKIASGAKYIVIDLKVGKGAFMKNTKDAKTLAEYMIKIGAYFKRKVVCVLTDMSSVLGYTVGDGLEVLEAVYFFLGYRNERLEKLVKTISSMMVSKGSEISLEKAKEKVDFVLSIGLSTHKLKQWIKAQGGDLKSVEISDKTLEIKSPKKGYITNIDPLKISKIVRSLSKEKNSKVGIRFTKNLYEKIEKDELMAVIYYDVLPKNIEKDIKDSIKIESILKDKKDIIIDVIE